MGRPRKNNKERWLSSKYNIGYLEPINGVAYTRIAGVRRTTKLRWLEKNRRDAVRILERRVLEYLHPELIPVIEESNDSITLFEAMREFKNARFQDYTENVIVVYRRTFNYFFKADMELEYEKMLQHIMHVNNTSELKVSTRKKYLVQLRRFFNFCKERGFIEKNPIDVIGVPKLPKKNKKLIFKRKEINKLIKHFMDNPNLHEYGYLIKFLSQTGLRIGEALSLTWKDVDDNGFVVHGKGSIDRYFPLVNPDNNDVIFPEVKEILEIMAKYQYEKVFRWRFPSKPQYHLNMAMEKLDIPKNIDGQSRSLHTFRSTAEYWWENELMLPFDVICDLAGHSMAVREGHYRKERGLKELAKVITHHIKKD